MSLPIPTSPATYVFVAWVGGFVLVGWGVLAPQRQGRFSAAIAKDTRARRSAQRMQTAVARAVALDTSSVRKSVRRAAIGAPSAAPDDAVALPIVAPVEVLAEIDAAPLVLPVATAAGSSNPTAAASAPEDVVSAVPSSTLPPAPPAAEETIVAVSAPAPIVEHEEPSSDCDAVDATVDRAETPRNVRPSIWARFVFWKRSAAPTPPVPTDDTSIAEMPTNDEAAHESQPIAEPPPAIATRISWTELVIADGADVDAGERRSMLETLGAIAEPWCGPIVARALAEELDPDLRDVALLAARDGRFHDAHDVVVPLLDGSREAERLLAVEVLAAIGDRGAVIHALQDETIAVAAVAAYELGKMMPASERDSLVHSNAPANADAILELLEALV